MEWWHQLCTDALSTIGCKGENKCDVKSFTKVESYFANARFFKEGDLSGVYTNNGFDLKIYKLMKKSSYSFNKLAYLG